VNEMASEMPAVSASFENVLIVQSPFER